MTRKQTDPASSRPAAGKPGSPKKASEASPRSEHSAASSRARRHGLARLPKTRPLRVWRLTTRGAVFMSLIMAACAVGAGVTLALGRPFPWQAVADVTAAMHLSETLVSQRARWEELALADYTIQVAYESGSVLCGPAVLEVRQGAAVVSPASAEHWFPPEVCNALISRFTVAGAFAWLGEEIEQFRPGATYLRARFDPEFGYPVWAERGIYDLLNEPERCCWRVTWSALQPLDIERGYGE